MEKRRDFLVVGMIKGKTPKKFIDHLMPYLKCTIVIPVDGHQFISPKKIVNFYKGSGKRIIIKENIEQSIEYISTNFAAGKNYYLWFTILSWKYPKKINSRLIKYFH